MKERNDKALGLLADILAELKILNDTAEHHRKGTWALNQRLKEMTDPQASLFKKQMNPGPGDPQVINPTIPYMCVICGEPHKTQEMLGEHLRDKHPEVLAESS